MGPEGNAVGMQVLLRAQTSGLLSGLLLQLQKDYRRAGLDYPIPERQVQEEDLAGIFAALKEDVYLLLMEHFEHYLNLMYAMDIPEREFREIQATDTVEVAHEVSSVILKREWQKIQWRGHSPKPDLL